MTVVAGAHVFANRNPEPETPDTVHCAATDWLKTPKIKPARNMFLNRNFMVLLINLF